MTLQSWKILRYDYREGGMDGQEDPCRSTSTSKWNSNVNRNYQSKKDGL